MTTIIRTKRVDGRSFTRGDQLARVMDKFNLEPEKPLANIDGDGTLHTCDKSRGSTFLLMESESDRTRLDIVLEDDARASDLIRELRMCGFTVTGQEAYVR